MNQKKHNQILQLLLEIEEVEDDKNKIITILQDNNLARCDKIDDTAADECIEKLKKILLDCATYNLFNSVCNICNGTGEIELEYPHGYISCKCKIKK